MKKLVLLATALVAALSMNAQITVGEQVVSGNIGLINNVYGSYYDSKFPPITVSYEYGLLENAWEVDGLSIGVGGVLAYTGAKDTWEHYDGSKYGYKYSSIIIAAKGYAHYDVMSLLEMPVENLDTYAALTLGYNIGTSKQWGDWYSGTGSAAAAAGLVYGFQIGARYWFSDNLAANLELGYGLATINLGVCYRF